MNARSRHAEIVPLAVLLTAAGCFGLWWGLAPERLAGWLGLDARRYGRLLGYVPGSLCVAFGLTVYCRVLARWSGAGRLGTRPPDPRRLVCRAWFWCLTVGLVGFWPPVLSAGRIRSEIFTGVLRLLTVLGLATYGYVRFVRRTPTDASRSRRAAVNLGLTLITVLWMAGGVEIYFRVWPKTDGLGVDRLGHLAWHRLYCRYTTYRLTAKDRKDWTAKLRTRALSKQKPAGVYRIAVIGDSVVFGVGVADPKDRFTNVLEGHLRQVMGRPVEVMNLGISGNSLHGHLELLLGLALPYQADLVVLVHNPNDLFHATGEPPYRSPEHHGLLRLLVDHSYAVSYFVGYRDVQWEFRTSYTDWLADRYNDRACWERHHKLLELFALACQQSRVPAVFVNYPFLATVDEYPSGLRAVHERLNHAAESLGLRTIDLLETFGGKDPRTLMVSGRDRHPNEGAHRMIAERLVQQLPDLLAD